MQALCRAVRGDTSIVSALPLLPGELLGERNYYGTRLPAQQGPAQAAVYLRTVMIDLLIDLGHDP
jgi:hypothetical protein